MRVGPLVLASSLLLVMLPVGDAEITGVPGRSHDLLYALDDHPDPGLHASFAYFPSADEVTQRLQGHAEHDWVTLHTVGTSGTGRPILLAEVTDPDSAVPYEDRVVTLILTQQHGNEPAGTPAALDLLDRITAGDAIAYMLHDQVLLLLPMANPDGATAETRGNADGVDINRDHIHLETPEANVMHAVLNRWDVQVAMDHHEYGGQGLGHPSPVRLYDHDLTTLFARHGNVDANVQRLAEQLMYEGIWPAAEAAGYSANEYGERTVAGEPLDAVAGGPDPGILRNHFGLHHVVGLLVETFVGAVEHPMHDAQRRADIHAVVMDATLQHVHFHHAPYAAVKENALAATIAEPWEDYIEGDSTGPIPDGFVLTTDGVSLLDLLGRHGIANGTVEVMADDDAPISDPVVDVRHGLQGHAAAILHPESSRQVAVTTPIELPDHDLSGADESAAVKESPGLAALSLALMVLALMGLTGRRFRPL